MKIASLEAWLTGRERHSDKAWNIWGPTNPAFAILASSRQVREAVEAGEVDHLQTREESLDCAKDLKLMEFNEGLRGFHVKFNEGLRECDLEVLLVEVGSLQCQKKSISGP